MLTCVNPDVTFKRKNGLRTKGVAVALRYLEGLMLKYGLCVPSSDSIRREILNLDIGETRKVMIWKVKLRKFKLTMFRLAAKRLRTFSAAKQIPSY